MCVWITTNVLKMERLILCLGFVLVHFLVQQSHICSSILCFAVKINVNAKRQVLLWKLDFRLCKSINCKSYIPAHYSWFWRFSDTAGNYRNVIEISKAGIFYFVGQISLLMIVITFLVETSIWFAFYFVHSIVEYIQNFTITCPVISYS